ncbi:RadC family protein [Halomonas sp. AOP1-B1-8]|uniref:RadC family protein n=1 Tax=Halomonas sp. AOP1-B1-8 TaxID=3457726 RepID=UPI003FDA2E2E
MKAGQVAQVRVKGTGHMAISAKDQAILNQASAILLREMKEHSTALTSPWLVKDFLRYRLELVEHEVFSVVFLDAQHRVIEFSEIFRGTIDSATVHPREVVKETLRHNAAAVILAHNHPSGVAEPSDADRRITDRLKSALELIDVRILDHMVVGQDQITSFAERGLI